MIGIIVVVGGAILLNAKKPTAGQAPSESTESIPPELLAPSFTLEKIGGGNGRMEDYKGKVVLLNFWATWCGPCKREIPDLIMLQKQYAGQGLQIVGVAFDQKPLVEQYVAEAEINYEVLIGTDDVATAFGGVPVIPKTFLIDRKGKIITTFEGMQEKKVLEQEIQKLL